MCPSWNLCRRDRQTVEVTQIQRSRFWKLRISKMGFPHHWLSILKDLTGKFILMRSLTLARGLWEVAVWVAEPPLPRTFKSSQALYKLTPEEFTARRTWILRSCWPAGWTLLVSICSSKLLHICICWPVRLIVIDFFFLWVCCCFSAPGDFRTISANLCVCRWMSVSCWFPWV